MLFSAKKITVASSCKKIWCIVVVLCHTNTPHTCLQPNVSPTSRNRRRDGHIEERHAHTLTRTETERERHTQTHTNTQRERERERPTHRHTQRHTRERDCETSSNPVVCEIVTIISCSLVSEVEI
jgi:hypothetical protein